MLSLFTTLPFVVCALSFATLALYWRKANPAQHILTFFFFVATTLYWGHAVYFSRQETILPVSDSAYAFATTAVYPIFYLYLRRLTHAGALRWQWWLVLLPAASMGIWAAWLYALYPTIPSAHEPRYLAMKVIGITQIALVCTFGLRHLYAFDRQVANYYADTEQRSVRKLRILLMLFVITSIGSAILTQIGREKFDETLFIIPSVVYSTLLFSIAQVGYYQRYDADQLQRDLDNDDRMTAQVENQQRPCPSPSPRLTATPDAYTAPISPQDDNDALLLRLQELMEEKLLFLHARLTLSELTQQLCTNRTRLSALINQHFGISFSDYINQLRIQHAISLLNLPDSSLSIREIGEQCGFGTEASFHRNFKKFTGKTPQNCEKTFPTPRKGDEYTI